MKYLNGTDDKKHDVTWVLFNDFWAVLFLIEFWVIVYHLLGDIFLPLLKGERVGGDIAWTAIGVVIILVVIAIGISAFTWNNAQYQLSEKGIRITYLFKKREIEWQDVKGISIRPLDVVRYLFREYVIVWLSDSRPYSDSFGLPLSLSACWFQRDAFIAIRKTDSRIHEILLYYTGPWEEPWAMGHGPEDGSATPTTS